MKKTSFLATAALLACLCSVTSLAFAQEPPRKAFGKRNPFNVEKLPAGKLKANLQSLDPQAREKAMKRLHTFDFTEFDAAEHLRADNTGGIFIVCPDNHGNCDGHSHGPAEPGEPQNSPSATESIAPEAAQAIEPRIEAISVSVSSPPAYNSKPNSTKHIYLDFNGGIVTRTQWNVSNVASYNVKVWSQDADRTTFNDAEQTWMRRIWQRVAEDYAPFDVNVTTDVAYDPVNYTGNKNNVGWLMICETTDNNNVALPHNGSGGVAYVDVYGRLDYTRYQPAWVSSTNGGGNEAIVAEAASHEMGHNMGLSHDATSTLAYYGGHAATASAPSWGPIMGTGYNRNVSQWSKSSEYFDGNQAEDDLSILSARIGYRADDHGNNFAGATGVVATNNTISQSGIIERTNDPDVFSFITGPGAITLTANSFRCDANTWGGNLDIILELYDSSQTLITSNNPAAETNASISTTVPTGGTYYVIVKPTGTGTPLANPPSGYSVYSSLGQYTLSGTLQPFDLLWSENFDGTITGWTSQTISGTPNSWAVTTDQSHSPTKSFFATGLASTSVAHLISPAISIPAEVGSPQIEFWHRYNLQAGRDGGRLSLSLDGGDWFDVTDSASGAAFTLNGYTTGMATTGQTGPFAGMQAWSGGNNTFSKTIITLTDIPKYAGKNLRIRWEIATNNSTASTGWNVDSVSLIGALGDTPSNQSPVITVAASTTSGETEIDGPTTYQIIRGTGSNLSVTATDDAGESNLTYTWSQTSGPAPVGFSVNGSNAAKNTTVTFNQVGDYILTATALDVGALSSSSSVNVRVPVAGTYVVTPSSASVQVGASQQFNASLFDQFDVLVASQLSPIDWSTSGGGAISSSGLFTAASIGGPFTITAVSGSYSDTASVTVTPAAATVELTNLSQTYTGGFKAVTVTTTPANLDHTVTYNTSSTVPTNAGTYAVVATVIDPNYVGSASGSLVVTKASQTINYAALGSVPGNQGSLALPATATSELAVSYTSSNTAVATISGSTANIIGLGTTSITASQTGDANFLAATNVQQSLTVVRADPLAVAGGPYSVLIGQSLSLNGNSSEPSFGENITSYEWDLNMDDTFSDATGANPDSISYETLNTTWSRVPGSNIIQLKVTDSAGKISIATTTLTVDGTAPTLTSITDDTPGGPILVNTLVTY
ncbi:MAG: MBG domain-containing protein, partial [Akkermansiaceae bacterium]